MEAKDTKYYSPSPSRFLPLIQLKIVDGKRHYYLSAKIKHHIAGSRSPTYLWNPSLLSKYHLSKRQTFRKVPQGSPTRRTPWKRVRGSGRACWQRSQQWRRPWTPTRACAHLWEMRPPPDSAPPWRRGPSRYSASRPGCASVAVVTPVPWGTRPARSSGRSKLGCASMRATARPTAGRTRSAAQISLPGICPALLGISRSVVRGFLWRVLCAVLCSTLLRPTSGFSGRVMRMNSASKSALREMREGALLHWEEKRNAAQAKGNRQTSLLLHFYPYPWQNDSTSRATHTKRTRSLLISRNSNHRERKVGISLSVSTGHTCVLVWRSRIRVE